MSDISSLIQNFVSLFADDTKLFTYLLETAEKLQKYSPESIQEDINSVAHWSERMQMRFNIDKCHTLHLGSNNPKHQYTIPRQADTRTKNSSQSYTYTFHNLTQVTEEKDLGVIVDENLNFNQHIDEKINKANQMLGIIRWTFKYMDINNFDL